MTQATHPQSTGEVRTAVDPISGKTVEIRNDLTKKLRGQYACGPTMANGEPEFGWRTFEAPPIQRQAADEIERLTERVKVLEAALATVNEQAEDEGLWFQPVYASEDYLQKAQRRLHEVIEGKTSEACAQIILARGERT